MSETEDRLALYDLQVRYSLAQHVQGSRRGRAINLGCCLISFD